MLPLQEVLSTPDAHSTIISAGDQILAIAAEVHAGYVPAVALGEGMEEG
jgi:hypothetical protein